MGYFATLYSKWSTLAWAHTYSARSVGTQRATFKAGHPLLQYPDIPAATAASQHVAYRADTITSLVDSLTGLPPPPPGLPAPGDVLPALVRLTGQGAKGIDFLRHPTQFQWAVDTGSSTARVPRGDCEDWAAWFAGVIIRSRLAERVELVCLSYTYPSGKAAAHMVCRYVTRGPEGMHTPGAAGGEEHHWWIGNWGGGRPFAGEVISGVETATKCRVTEAISWRVALAFDGSLLLTYPQVLRAA